MKVKFTLFLTCFLLILLTTSGSASAQTAGDFRSNGTGGGDWQTISSWQTFDGTTWQAATVPPDATSGVITVRTGDSINLAAAINVDQVVVQANAMLAFNGATVTLNHTASAGADLENFGRLYVRNNGFLIGAGTVNNNNGALIKVEFTATVNVTTSNLLGGEVRFSQTSGIDGATLTNGGLINWEDNPLYILNGGSIVNNDSIAILPTTSVSLNSNGGGGSLINNAAGVIYLVNPGLVLTSVSTATISNNGTIRGFGSINPTTIGSNTGTIIAGDDNNPTILAVGGPLTTSGSPTYKINLVSNSATPTAGASYSQVALANGVNLSTSTLTVLDNATGDAIGATYTVMTATAGSFTGTFATTNLPANIGTLTVSGNTVTVTRTGTLPLTWGSFNVRAAGSQAVLNWTTLQESNTDAFIIERSSDGISFSPIGTVKASGNTSKTSAYTFTDASPSLQGYNYYRLQQTDLDGKKSYSQINVIGFGSKSAVYVQTSPNPVRDLLNITVQADNIMIGVTDMNGRTVKQLRLNRGFHQTPTNDLAPGVYQLTFYQGYNKIGGQQLIKF